MNDEPAHDDSPAIPGSKAVLLERIQMSRAALDQMIGTLSEAQMIAPGPQGGWSVKDHLAHLAAWERGIAALLEKQPRYAAMGVGEAPLGTMDDLNEIIYQRNKDVPLPGVLANFRDAQRQMDAALAGLDDADLFKPYSAYQADARVGNSDGPIINWIIGNTYEHYAEHQAWMAALIA